MTTVVLDTDVFSVLFDDRPGADKIAATVQDRRAPLAFPSIAELITGARHAQWGAARLGRLEAAIERAGYLMPTAGLLRLCGLLRADALRLGHPLGQPEHTNDLWIASCAIHYEVPLLTNNRRHFAGLPGLELLPV